MTHKEICHSEGDEELVGLESVIGYVNVVHSEEDRRGFLREFLNFPEEELKRKHWRYSNVFSISKDDLRYTSLV